MRLLKQNKKRLTNKKRDDIMCKVNCFTLKKVAKEMLKNLSMGYLLDFYGSLLSARQQDIMELYYNEDLSLAEISDNMGITRQGVHDALKKAEHILVDAESKMNLVERFKKISAATEKLGSRLKIIQDKIGHDEDEQIRIKLQGIIEDIGNLEL